MRAASRPDAITTLASGHANECATLASSQVECWGLNEFGELGDGTFTSSPRPVLVPRLHGVRQVALGFGHVCALLATSRVVCWGWNANGQLGDDVTQIATSPQPVRALAGARKITAGFEHSCAVLRNGTVRCWGWNFYGQLGDGSQSRSWLPVPVLGLHHAVDVAAGYSHTCAILSNHTVECWGWGTAGQLGDGTYRSSSRPVHVRGLHDAVQLALGYASTCALLATGAVECWGRNNDGQLGDASFRDSATPVVVHHLPAATSIAAGYGHECAALRSGTVDCWGFNQDGQLGDGRRANVTVARPTGLLRQVIAVTAGDDSTCALLRIRVYSCWGLGQQGELGNGRLGGGPRSEVLEPPYLPSAPRPALATLAGTEAVVRWHQPGDEGAGGVTGYVARAVDHTTPANGGEECRWRSGPLRCVIQGLVYGDDYTFDVTPESAVGVGTSAPTPPVVPMIVPGPPQAVTATFSNASARVSWTPGNSGGATTVHYTARATDATNAADGNQVCSTTSTSCTLDGLTNGDTYTFSVIATNRAGASPRSAASAPGTPATSPTPPIDVTATAGNAEATVSWQPPASDGGDSVTRYTVLAFDTTNPDNSGPTCSSAPPTLSCTVTGLTNGDSYTFEVTATSPGGTSAAATSPSITPVTVPGAPSDVLATPGNRQAAVSWTAPSDGGATIVSYTVTANDSTNANNGGERCTVSGNPSNPGCTVTGLANGDDYTFTVTANNGDGTSAASTPSVGVVPSTVPDPPQDLHASAASGTVTVTWAGDSPANDEGSKILSYTVTTLDETTSVNLGTSACPWNGSTSAPSCTATGLSNGQDYEFSVTATNADGTGSAATVSTTPMTVPTAPQDVVATSGNGEAGVTWAAPASDGGSPLTGYRIDTFDESTASDLGFGPCTWGGNAGDLGCTATGLSNGDTYSFTVTATNAAGSSPGATSNGVVPAGPPDPPLNVTASPRDQQVLVTWSPPFDEGSAIKSYAIDTFDSSTGTDLGDSVCTWNGDADNPACSATALSNGDLYEFSVTATNGIGTSSPAGATATPSSVPDAPSVSATPAVQGATVTWSVPGDEGSPITSYTVDTVDQTTGTDLGDSVCTWNGDPVNPGCTASGLTTGDAYYFVVTAANADGPGAPGTSAVINAL